KICDIYRTSVDYNPSAEMTQRFFQTVQNKMHWAVHGRTAAEIIHQRAIATQPHMGLTSWKVSTNVHPRIGTMNRRATLLGFGVPALAGCRFRYATTEACRLKPGLRTGPTDGDSWRGPARPRARVRVTNSTQRENCGVGQLRNFRLSTLIHGKPRN
ncbi:MAG: virulence RhuM family protein, partial [Verrucomicrobia bacterium]|nr:virulence RhuM family protein [Verrucomicrobiota bacterium]